MVKINLSDTPDYQLAAKQIAQLRVETMTVRGGTEEDPQPIKVDVDFTIAESANEEDVGLRVSRRFWLGTLEDPNAEQPITRRSRDFISFRKFLKSANVPIAGSDRDLTEYKAMAEGQELMGKVAFRRYKGKNGETLVNTVWDFYGLGTKELQVLEDKPAVENGLDTTVAPASGERVIPRYAQTE